MMQVPTFKFSVADYLSSLHFENLTSIYTGCTKPTRQDRDARLWEAVLYCECPL
jgi:hypothetical protein